MGRGRVHVVFHYRACTDPTRWWLAIAVCLAFFVAGCAYQVTDSPPTENGRCMIGPAEDWKQGVWATSASELGHDARHQSVWTDGSTVVLTICGLDSIPDPPPKITSDGVHAAAMGMQISGGTNVAFLYPYFGWQHLEYLTGEGVAVFDFHSLPHETGADCSSSMPSGGPLSVVSCGVATVIDWRTPVAMASAQGLFADVELASVGSAESRPLVTVMTADTQVVDGRLVIRVALVANQPIPTPVHVTLSLRQLLPEPGALQLPISSPVFTYAPSAVLQ